MSEVEYLGERVPLRSGETVLDALLRAGHAIPSGCRSGVCQSCVMVAESDAVPAAARRGLSDAQLALNHFLACQCVPPQPLLVQSAAPTLLRESGRVLDKTLLAPDILRLRLQAGLSYRAGQFASLWISPTLGRSYSLASHPQLDDFLEFHIRILPDGQFSRRLWEQVEVGAELQIQGPLGQCFYTGRPDQPMILVGSGTGLAPLYGVLRDAFQQGHQAPIDLVVAARTPQRFYLLDELRELAQQRANLRLHLLVQEGAMADARVEDVYTYCHRTFTTPKGSKVYLCGADTLVKKLRRQFFLDGAGMRDIAADAFLPCG